MVPEISLLVMLVDLLDAISCSPPQRGRRPVYSDRLFLKALVIMLVHGLPTVGGLLAILEQPTPETQALRPRVTEGGRFPSHRTRERRLNALPPTLPARIGGLGRELVARLRPWEACGLAAAIDSTVLPARGVWREKDRGARIVHAQFEGIFDPHGSVPTRDLVGTRRRALGAVFVYQLTLLHRFQHGGDLRVGLKAFLKPPDRAAMNYDRASGSRVLPTMASAPYWAVARRRSKITYSSVSLTRRYNLSRCSANSQ